MNARDKIREAVNRGLHPQTPKVIVVVQKEVIERQVQDRTPSLPAPPKSEPLLSEFGRLVCVLVMVLGGLPCLVLSEQLGKHGYKAAEFWFGAVFLALVAVGFVPLMIDKFRSDE